MPASAGNRTGAAPGFERMARQGLERDLVDATVYQRAVDRFREAGIVMPTFAQLAQPATIPDAIEGRLASVDPDAPDPLNLFRTHWFNGPDRRARVGVPQHLVLPSSLTGVDAPIVIALGDRFPMIAAHKVLAAYACLAPRIITGQFDPTSQRAVWPSTGNYCRGGVAISRIMGCRGVAVLPEGMSRERFAWLEGWVADPGDIIRTPGTESNVKEIYDRCAELEQDAANVILNQFSEFGNHLAPLPRDRPGPRGGGRGPAPSMARPAPGGLRVGDRLGRDDRRRRLAQGPLSGR